VISFKRDGIVSRLWFQWHFMFFGWNWLKKTKLKKLCLFLKSSWNREISLTKCFSIRKLWELRRTHDWTHFYLQLNSKIFIDISKCFELSLLIRDVICESSAVAAGWLFCPLKLFNISYLNIQITSSSGLSAENSFFAVH
jgi:hypothetical protein